jgi:phosphoglucomutase
MMKKDLLEGMILSASGWRGIFAKQGLSSALAEQSSSPNIYPEKGLVAAAGALVFARYLERPPFVLVGMDARPTGPAIADILIRAFLASGVPVRFAGICAAPEIMALSRKPSSPFVYVTASHNPIGHNGLKFGRDGGVLPGAEAEKLIAAARALLGKADEADAGRKIKVRLAAAKDAEVRGVYAKQASVKKEALAAYEEFSLEVISGGPQIDADKNADIMNLIAAGLKQRPLGIACDFNGSARAACIDSSFIQSFGIQFAAINDKPGKIVHEIIPEGENLIPCSAFLESLHSSDPAFVLGYVPDCDGDRGNVVIRDDRANCTRILEAQEVFALCCAAELAHQAMLGEENPAVAVNGPTSLRVDRIAAAFGARVFRAEVGEANVVNLARDLRGQGYSVRIMGEGSNGGNITWPSSVRDPLATIFSLVKLLAVPEFFDTWLKRINREQPDHLQRPGRRERENKIQLPDIIDSLPAFYTTGVSTPEAKLEVAARDHALLKKRYQKIFLADWEAKKAGLEKRWGITGWEARACVGTKELRSADGELDDFGDAQTGGLKIVFKAKDKEGTDKAGTDEDAAFIWMRGSKTEPVFRVMADAQSPELERELIAWQRDMVARADRE